MGRIGARLNRSVVWIGFLYLFYRYYCSYTTRLGGGGVYGHVVMIEPVFPRHRLPFVVAAQVFSPFLFFSIDVIYT